MLVLIGYIHLANSLEYLQKNPDKIPKFEKTTTKTSKIFYQNGHKLAQKYLSDDHYLTKKFNYLLNHGKEDLGSNIKPLYFQFNAEDSEKNQGRNNSFLNRLDSFDRTSEIEIEESSNKKSRDFRVKAYKSFQNDARTKSLNKVRSNEENEESFQANFSNVKLNKNNNNMNDFPKYKKKMKEIDRTIKEMKKLKEKYERNESTFFLQKNLELLLQQKELENFISKKRDFQSNFMYPSSGMFYAPQQPPQPNFITLNKSQIEPSFATNELILQKQKEMEMSLLTLQKENLKISYEKDEKMKEMEKLKDYVMKLEAERTSNELEKKVKNFDNSNSKDFKKQLNNDMNLAPLSSYNNLNESNISETSNKQRGKFSNREERKFNLPLDNLKKEEIGSLFENRKKSDIEIKGGNNLKRLTGGANEFSKDNIQIDTVINKLSNYNNAPGLRKSSSKIIKEEQERNMQRQEKPQNLIKTQQEKASFQEKPQIQEKNQIQEKTQIQEKPQIQKKRSIQEPQILENMLVKNMINLNNHKPLSIRAESIKKILIDYKGTGFTTMKLESFKKGDSLSSMDMALDGVNPSHLLKNILSSFYKAIVVRKKVYLDSKVYIFEFRISQENEASVFKLISFYEANNKPAIKEEILQISLIRKILQNIDYRDVIPFIYPLKTISSVMKFSRYFILPFLGIGDAKSPGNEEINGDKKVEIWPKAHGLIDKNIKLVFLGDEFFVFFHFLVNDCFRLILSKAKK